MPRDFFNRIPLIAEISKKTKKLMSSMDLDSPAYHKRAVLRSAKKFLLGTITEAEFRTTLETYPKYKNARFTRSKTAHLVSKLLILIDEEKVNKPKQPSESGLSDERSNNSTPTTKF